MRRGNAFDEFYSRLDVGIRLPPQSAGIDDLAAVADLTKCLTPFPLFGIGEAKLLQLALEAEGLLLDLESGHQRGGFGSQPQPQPEGDLLEPRMGLGGYEGDRRGRRMAFAESTPCRKLTRWSADESLAGLRPTIRSSSVWCVAVQVCLSFVHALRDVQACRSN